MTTLAQSLRALSPMRDLYQLQSRMTVNGHVPTMDEVRAQFNSRPGDTLPLVKATPSADAGAGSSYGGGGSIAKPAGRRQGKIAPDAASTLPEMPDSDRMNCGKPVSRREIAKKSGTGFYGGNAQADARASAGGFSGGRETSVSYDGALQARSSKPEISTGPSTHHHNAGRGNGPAKDS